MLFFESVNSLIVVWEGVSDYFFICSHINLINDKN